MLSMLGIKQIAVVVNKMDLVDYDQDTYQQIVEEYTDFLAEIGLEAETFIPVSGMLGDNVAAQSDKMDWYHGQTVLEQLDSFENEALPHNKPFRMPVQDVYKFTKGGDDRRIVAGTVEAGEMNVGDEVVFYPSGKKSTVKSIEGFKEDKQHKVKVGKATGFTLDEQIYITRGELAARADEAEPRVSARIKANLFWLARQDLVKDKVYYLKVGTAKVKARLQKINRVIDASNLNQDENKEKIERHDVAEVVFKLDRAMAFDLAGEIEETSRFVIVDEFEIAGGGIISEALEDEQSWVREKVMRRNYKWEQSLISREERAEKYNQKSTLILITGEEDVGKKPTAKALEKRLFNDGKVVYFLGIGNLLYGVDADIKNGNNNNQEEHLRRLAEVSHLMLDAGAILIVTAVELTQANLELIKTTVNPQQIETVWLGDRITTDLEFDLHIPEFTSEDQVSAQIKGLLQDRGIIFRPW
jgi:bifunctional enzyme CysN/CysC